MKVDPLIDKRSKKKVSVIQPKVVNQTIQQMDNILIENLVENKLIIGSKDKIKSSGYSVQDILRQVSENTPIALQAGNNIIIQDNVISSVPYNDGDIISNMDEIKKETKTVLNSIDNQIYNTIPKEIEDLQNQMIELNNTNKKSNTECIKKYDKTKEDIQKIQLELDSINIENNKNIDELNHNIVIKANEINDVLNTIKNQNNDNNLEITNKLEDHREKIEQGNILYMENQTNLEKLDEKIKNLVSDNTKSVEKHQQNIQNKFNKLYDYIDDKFTTMNNNMLSKIDKYNEANKELIQKKNVEIKDLRSVVSDLQKQVQNVTKLDPNSKQLQKYINLLSTKLNIIESTFSFDTKRKD